MTHSRGARDLAALAAPLTKEQLQAAARLLTAVADQMPATEPAPKEAPPPDPALRRLLGYEDAAAYLGVSSRRLHAAAAEGEVLKVHIGHRVLFDKVDLDDYVERLKREA